MLLFILSSFFIKINKIVLLLLLFESILRYSRQKSVLCSHKNFLTEFDGIKESNVFSPFEISTYQKLTN